MITPKPLSESSEKPLPQTVFQDQGGHQVGQYQLLEVIGSGGMGVVYKALHTRLRQVFALKTLAGAALLDPRAIDRFNREMAALGSLIHPNIVRATDAGDWQGAHYLVMEYVEGIDLKKAVQIYGPLEIADACETIRQAAVGLQHIHENKRVHRDLKPSNLMLTPDGQVKILDLGLALLYGEGGTKEEITGSQQVMGTADFMAPEQWLDSHQVDIRADLYSLGCTLYKLLTGKEPFAFLLDKNQNKRQAHLTMPVPDIRGLRPDVPEGLVPILERLLAKDPEERYSRPAELAEALRPFCQGSDLAKLPALTLAMKTREDTESKKTVTYQLGMKPAETLPSSGKRTSRRYWALLLLGVLGLVAVAFALNSRKPEPVLPWPADFPQAMKNRLPGQTLALVDLGDPRPNDPNDEVRGQVDPVPTKKTYRVAWFRRLTGTGVFYEMPRAFRLDSAPFPQEGTPTVLALDDDLQRNWFDLEAVLLPPAPNGKNYGGLFFGWQRVEPGKCRAYFLCLENVRDQWQIKVAPLTFVTDKEEDIRIAPLPSLAGKEGCKVLVAGEKQYRIHLRILPDEILVTVNGKEIARLTPAFDPRGPCGIWAQEGQARFERIAVTPLTKKT